MDCRWHHSMPMGEPVYLDEHGQYRLPRPIARRSIKEPDPTTPGQIHVESVTDFPALFTILIFIVYWVLAVALFLISGG